MTLLGFEVITEDHETGEILVQNDTGKQTWTMWLPEQELFYDSILGCMVDDPFVDYDGIAENAILLQAGL